MTRIEWLGLPLSALALVVFAWMLLDWIRRRHSFPALLYGSRTIQPRMVSWLWLLVLVGSLLLAKEPVLSRTESALPAVGDFAELAAGQQGSRQVISSRTWNVTLPFYRYARSTESIAGGLHIESTTRALLFPLWTILGLFLYWRFVMRDPITRPDAHDPA
jgi:hypothetical protein